MTTILVIEDEQALLATIQQMLEFEDFEVLTATDGVVGIALASGTVLAADPPLADEEKWVEPKEAPEDTVKEIRQSQAETRAIKAARARLSARIGPADGKSPGAGASVASTDIRIAPATGTGSPRRTAPSMMAPGWARMCCSASRRT